jgi:hypothetical protein
VGFALWHPDSETIWDPQMVALGFDPVTRGREARVDGHKLSMAAWGEVRLEPEELIDLGDSRLLLLAHLKGSGLSSGAAVDLDGAFLVTISAGRVIHERCSSTGMRRSKPRACRSGQQRAHSDLIPCDRGGSDRVCHGPRVSGSHPCNTLVRCPACGRLDSLHQGPIGSSASSFTPR